MHVMQIIDALMVGGAERMLVDISNALVKKGIRVSVCMTRKEGVLKSHLDRSINTYCLKRGSRFDLGGLYRFKEMIQQEKPDILHVHSRSTCALVALYCIILNIRIPLIFHDHCGSVSVDRTIPFWFKLYGKKRIQAYIGVSEESAKWASDAGYPHGNIYVINNAIDLSRYRFNEQIFSNHPFLTGLFVAGIRYEKGLHLLIESMSKISGKEKVKILIIGGVRNQEYYEQCKVRIEELQVKDQFEFIGERIDVVNFICQSDFGVIPSIWESGPLVLIEYIVSGLPVIYTRVGEISNKLLKLHVPGAICPDNLDDLICEMDRLIDLSPVEFKERGRIGRKIAEDGFDISRKIDDFINVYYSIESK